MMQRSREETSRRKLLSPMKIKMKMKMKMKMKTMLVWTTVLWTLQAISLTSFAGNSNNSSFAQIPGLYSLDDLITPIQGREQFESLVRGANKSNYNREHQLSLVQFYMATCPDCQGFSPYFKRFVQDIAPHWRRLVRVFVVNCNDDLNINLCWRENPNLIVPQVRWYTIPALIRQLDRSKTLVLFNATSGAKRQFFPDHLVSVAHRDYIEKQRRDLISLRHATLRFMSSIVDQFEAAGDHLKVEEWLGDKTWAESLYESLEPVSWRHLQPLGRPKQEKLDLFSAGQFSIDLMARQSRCRKSISGAKEKENMVNFIVFEPSHSYLGKTLVADWSNYSCSVETSKLFMVHYSNKLGLLGTGGLNITEPQLYYLETKFHHRLNDGDIELQQVAISGQLNMRRRRRWTQQPTVQQVNQQRLSQRMSLEQYYSKRRPATTSHRHPAHMESRMAKRLLRRWALESTTIAQRPVSNEDLEKAKNKAQLDAENINWAPPELYPNEELLRYNFNRAIAHRVLAPDTNFQQQVAGWKNDHFGEIKSPPRGNQSQQVVSPKDEDLSLVRLTDYYKVLDEVVHKNMRQRAQLDGYQLLGAACFLRQLVQHFPFQGASPNNHHESSSSTYLIFVQREFIKKLEKKLKPIDDILPESDLSRACSESLESLPEELSSRMNSTKVTSSELDELEESVVQRYQLGLPAEAHFKWAYCAGSSAYLRGHTCSLWLLFHTMTVHEYLATENNTIAAEDLEYKFVVPNNASEYSLQNRPPCDPNQPETAFLSSSSRELFVKAPQFALANIINFIRYFMSCTNCAAHFSCMVERSMAGLNFLDPKPADHLLFLWEAHNRVNLRTKNTHSEDPNHPKHVFPTYEACPACYLDKPSSPAEQLGLDRIRFNKQELVNFLVARYRRSAILNNKINIENLYRRRPTAATTTTAAPV